MGSVDSIELPELLFSLANNKNMINITALGLYMLISSMTPNSAALSAPIMTDATLIPAETQKLASAEEVKNAAVDVEAYVRNYFSDTPILAEVARCESEFRQFGSNGKVLRGVAVAEDVGVMQINERYHLAQSKKLGMDIYTLNGNLAYGRYLYEKQGAKPWMASSPCWSKVTELASKSDKSLNFN